MPLTMPLSLPVAVAKTSLNRRGAVIWPRQTPPRMIPGEADMPQVHAFTRMFGHKAAVDRAGFNIDRPAFVGIIGRSWAGKSTVLRMMNRFVDATSGEIRGQCAMIFQQFNPVTRMDVASNVLHGIVKRRSNLQTLFNL